MAQVTVVRTSNTSQLESLLSKASASSTYLTILDGTQTYLTQSSASTTYATKASPSLTGSVNLQGELNFDGIGYPNRSLNFMQYGEYAGKIYATDPMNGDVELTLESYPEFQGIRDISRIRITGGGGVITESVNSLGQTQALWNAPNGLEYYSIAGQALKIDTSGRVTKPRNPVFSVYCANLGTQSGNLTYNATNNNNGGYMNLSTGLFTAPVAGYYYFNYHAFVESGLTGNTTVTFQKNGSTIPSRIYNDFNDASYGPGISLSIVTYLAVNDNVRVNVTGAGMHGNDDSFFKGFLIG